MAIPSQRDYDKLHAKRLKQYSRLIRNAYTKLINEVSTLATPLSLNPADEFYFRNNPEVSKKVNALLKTLYQEVYGATVMGVNSGWQTAVDKNNAITEYVFGAQLNDLPKEYRELYLSNNGTARRNFLARKDNGLGLSGKVWKNTRQLKTELELSLELGLGNGSSAQTIAKDIKGYLNDPDRLYRRIRDKEGGPLRLSKAAKAYNPGAGQYRSSYKNALRLTRNEINFSYEGSQYEKRKQQDFIVGTYIRTSPGHRASDDKGGISCIDLQGKYPKDFDWTYKWHVNCICYSTSIIKSREELDKDTTLILEGKDPTTPSKKEVKKVPGNYTRYLKDNKEKWKNWKNPPRTFTTNR